LAGHTTTGIIVHCAISETQVFGIYRKVAILGSKFKRSKSRETEQQPQVVRQISPEALANLKRPLEGDIWFVKVKEIHAKGDAIAVLPKSGMICIIKERNIKPGDLVQVKIVKVKDKYCFAKFAKEP
jgi:predicted RNA-binding protein with TRAM domain